MKMCDNIPLEIQMEIMERIPDVKWVVHCRSVSKAWKSVIDSKEFVAAHTLRHAHDQAQPHHLLIRKQDCRDKPVKYLSIVDDDTFPHQKVSVFVPDSVNKISHDSRIVGRCHGLFCVYEVKTSTAVIWNPLLPKTVGIAVPNVPRELYYRTFLGFGLCPVNLDPKLVKITYVSDWSKLGDVNTSTQVEVFTLSYSGGGTWRSGSNIPNKSIGFGFSQAVVDGVIYWDAIDHRVVDVDDDAGPRNPNLIMSFDLTTEEFTKVDLPNCLALYPYAELSVSNLRESLAVIEFDVYIQRQVCDVWIMTGHGSTRSFNRLYSIHVPDSVYLDTVLVFRKSGAPIIESESYNEDYYIPNGLAIYEPESRNITDIEIQGLYGSFFGHSYKETLLLLGH